MKERWDSAISDDQGALRQSGLLPAIGRRIQLNQEVATLVRELIMSGQLSAGEQLNIDRFAKELVISPTPVREAFLTLKGEGFVQFEPRRGFRVAPLLRADVSDLFLFQSSVAGELAARASLVMSARNLKRIEDMQRGMEQAAKAQSFDALERLNFEFHRTINEAAESRKLAWLLSVVVRYVPRRFYSMIPGWPGASLDDHRSVIEALKAHDPDASRGAMEQHIKHAGELLIAHLEDRGFWDEGEEGRNEG